MFDWVTGFEVQVAFTKSKIMRQREQGYHPGSTERL